MQSLPPDPIESGGANVLGVTSVSAPRYAQTGLVLETGPVSAGVSRRAVTLQQPHPPRQWEVAMQNGASHPNVFRKLSFLPLRAKLDRPIVGAVLGLPVSHIQRANLDAVAVCGEHPRASR